MYCKKCGNEITNEDTFCAKCGAVTGAQGQPQPNKVEIPPMGNVKPPKPKKSRNALWISLFAVLLVLVASALIVVFVVLPASDTQNTTDSYVIYVNDGEVMIFEDIFEYDNDQITYEIDGEEYDELFSDDFMDEPTDITVLIEDENGDLRKTVFIPGVMIVDTEQDDSVRWSDYDEAQTLYVSDEIGVVELSDIVELTSVTVLFLDKCTNITDIDDISEMEQLQGLSICIMDIDDIDVLEDLKSLNRLDLLVLDNLDDFDVLEDLHSLKSLRVSAINIDEISDLGALESLESLIIISIQSLTDVQSIEDFSSLKFLKLKNISTLEDIDALDELESLESLSLFSLHNLESIDVLEDINGLRELFLINLSLVDEDDADDIIDYLEDNDVTVYADNLYFEKDQVQEPVSQVDPQEPVSQLDTSGLTIGFINAGPDDYYAQFADAFITIAEYEGFEVIVMQSDYSPEKELSNAKDLIAAGVDALAVITVSSNRSADTIALANDAGVPIFFIAGKPSVNPGDTLNGHVTDNFVMIGYLAGQWVAQNYPDAVCVNIPGFMGQGPAEGEIVGFDMALAQAGMPPAILLPSSDWQRQYAIPVARDLIASGLDFDVLFACNDETYFGVQQVFDELGITDKIIVSANAKDDTWPNLLSGELAASSPNPPSLNADLCVQQIMRYLNGEDFVQSLQIVPPSVITGSNIDTAIPWSVTAYMRGRKNNDFQYLLEDYERAFLSNIDLFEAFDTAFSDYMN
jgi:ABC-type sugar transport system substrate-binding protein